MATMINICRMSVTISYREENSVRIQRCEPVSHDFFVNPAHIVCMEKACYKGVECTLVTLITGAEIPTTKSMDVLYELFKAYTK